MTFPATPESPSSPAGVAAWRVLFRMMSGISALFLFAYWAAAGANRNWSQTIRVPIKHTSNVSGADVAAYKDHFAPGIEILGLGLLLCVALFAITFLRGKAR